MKRITQLLSILLIVTGLFACNKDDDNNTTTPSNNQTACNGMNLCFKLDGTEESHNAKWKVITGTGSGDRYRVLWEEGSGTTYKNIEMDIYGTTTGTYNVSNSPAAGDGGFQYFSAAGTNIVGESGTIEVTSIDNANNTISGKFTITAKDGNGTTHQITEGNFVNVPQ